MAVVMPVTSLALCPICSPHTCGAVTSQVSQHTLPCSAAGTLVLESLRAAVFDDALPCVPAGMCLVHQTLSSSRQSPHYCNHAGSHADAFGQLGCPRRSRSRTRQTRDGFWTWGPVPYLPPSGTVSNADKPGVELIAGVHVMHGHLHNLIHLPVQTLPCRAYIARQCRQLMNLGTSAIALT